jgi:hypothetical protein
VSELFSSLLSHRSSLLTEAEAGAKAEAEVDGWRSPSVVVG